MYTIRTHIHTHTHTYIYMYVCMYACMGCNMGTRDFNYLICIYARSPWACSPRASGIRTYQANSECTCYN